MLVITQLNTGSTAFVISILMLGSCKMLNPNLIKSDVAELPPAASSCFEVDVGGGV